MLSSGQRKLKDFFKSRGSTTSNEMSMSRKEAKEKIQNTTSANATDAIPKKRSTSPQSHSINSPSKKAASHHLYSNTDFGTCPICNKLIPLYRIDHHLDGGECDPTKDDSPKLAKFPVGLKVISNFVSLEEEKKVLAQIEKDPSWGLTHINGQRLSLFYGCGIDLKNRQAFRGDELPIWIHFVLERFKSIPELAFFVPNHLHINRYIKKAGHSIRPHMDDRQFGGEIFVIVSLVNDCTMIMSREKNPNDFIRVLLPRFSLEIMSKESRYHWKHAIANEDLHGEERVSLVFRQVKLDPRDIIIDPEDKRPLIRY